MDTQAQLIEAAQQGSSQAFAQLVYAFEGQMMALATALAAFPDEAEDIYQEALLHAYTSLPNFRHESQFSTWLYRIFVNTASTYKRRLSQRFSRYLHAEPPLVESACSPQQGVENAQLGQAIAQAVLSLSHKERIAFVLCHQQELGIGEAADIMCCTAGAVKSYLFRAREKLRRALAGYRGGKTR